MAVASLEKIRAFLTGVGIDSYNQAFSRGEIPEASFISVSRGGVRLYYDVASNGLVTGLSGFDEPKSAAEVIGPRDRWRAYGDCDRRKQC